MNSVGRPLNRKKVVADPSQFVGQWSSVVKGYGSGCSDDAVVISTSMLSDMLVSIAKPAIVISRKFRKESDDAAGVSPTAKHDQRLFVGHDCSPDANVVRIYGFIRPMVNGQVSAV